MSVAAAEILEAEIKDLEADVIGLTKERDKLDCTLRDRVLLLNHTRNLHTRVAPLATPGIVATIGDQVKTACDFCNNPLPDNGAYSTPSMPNFLFCSGWCLAAATAKPVANVASQDPDEERRRIRRERDAQKKRDQRAADKAAKQTSPATKAGTAPRPN